ncbi:hypothetical protein HAX54_004379, partial [Datura stramonium]|nr:hypothetical protein [Datura stramonium]
MEEPMDCCGSNSVSDSRQEADRQSQIALSLDSVGDDPSSRRRSVACFVREKLRVPVDGDCIEEPS